MKRKLRILIACSMVLTLILSMTACSWGNKNSSENTATTNVESLKPINDGTVVSTKNTLNIGIEREYGTLSPLFYSMNPGYCFYDTLYNYDNTTQTFTPNIASSWERKDDTHMTMKLRQDVTDSAGNKFTAHDAVYSINFMMNELISSFYLQAIDLKQTKAIDDYTLEIVLKEPSVIQWYALADIKMFCEASMNASKDKMTTTPVSTGPYILDSYSQGSKISMKARDDYWGTKPAIKNINWMVIPEASQRAAALESGEIDLTSQTSPADFERLKENEKFATYQGQSTLLDVIYFNCSENSIFKNVKLRQAVAYAIDKKAISDLVFNGLFKPCKLPGVKVFGADTTWNDAAGYFNTNLDKSKALLKETGFVKGTKIVIGNPGLAANAQESEIIQGALMELGFDVQIKSYESAAWDTACSDPKSGMDIQVHNAGCPEGYFTNNIKAELVMGQCVFYKNDEFFNLLNQSMQTTDKTEQLVVNKKINDILVRDVPILTLVDYDYLYSFNKNLVGVDVISNRVIQRLLPQYYYFK